MPAPEAGMPNGNLAQPSLTQSGAAHQHFQPAHLDLPASLGTGTEAKHITQGCADDGQRAGVGI